MVDSFLMEVALQAHVSGSWRRRRNFCEAQAASSKFRLFQGNRASCTTFTTLVFFTNLDLVRCWYHCVCVF